MESASMTNRIGEAVEEIAESSAALVREHAMPATMAVFGLGLGTGIALVYLLCDPSHVEQANVAQRLGRRMLDALAGVVPDSLAKVGR